MVNKYNKLSILIPRLYILLVLSFFAGFANAQLSKTPQDQLKSVIQNYTNSDYDPMLKELVYLIEQHPHVPLGYYYPGQIMPESSEDKRNLRNIMTALVDSSDFVNAIALQAAVLKEKGELKEAEASWQWLIFLKNGKLSREINLDDIQPSIIYKNRLLINSEDDSKIQNGYVTIDNASEVSEDSHEESAISPFSSDTMNEFQKSDAIRKTPTVSLNQYLELVLSGSPEVGQVQSQTAQITAETREQRALNGPAANLGFRYSPKYLSEINEFGFGYRYRSNVSISQSVLPEVRELKQLQRQEDAQSAYSSNLLIQTKQNVIVGATIAYLETAMAERRAEFTKRLVDIAADNLALFRRRNETGEARNLEVLEARQQLLEAESLAQDAEYMLNTANVRFRSLLPENNRNITAIQEWIDPGMAAESLQIDAIVDTHPEITEYNHLLTLEEIRSKLNKVDNFDLDMSVGYNLYGRDEFFQSRQWDVRLSAGFPLFMSKIGKYREQQREAAQQRLQYEKAEQVAKLRQSIAEAEQQYLQSIQQKRLLEQDLEIAREKLRITEATIEYDSGQMNSDLLAERYDAMKDLMSAELALSTWPYQQSIYYVDLLGTTGKIPQTSPIFETVSEKSEYQKAIWFYNREKVGAGDSTDTIITQLLDHKFNTVYLAIGYPGDPFSLFENEKAYAEFINSLQALGVNVELLMGDGSWLRMDEFTSLMNRMNLVMDFYRTYARFDGIHFDIEPHTISEWDIPEERQQIISYFPELLQKLSDRIRSFNSQIKISADIPTWFEEFRLASWPQGENLLTRTLEIVDQVVIMDYSNDFENIINEIADELRQARIYGTPLQIGLKVKQESPPLSNTSFYGVGRQTLSSTMDEIYSTLEKLYPGLQGFALYNFQGYFSMKD